MNFQGVVMNVADLNRSIDFYREVLGFYAAVPRGAVGGGERSGERPNLRSSCCERLGAVLSEELAISVCEPSYWKSSQPINWSGSRAIWTLGGSSSAGVITAEWTAVVGRDPDGVAVVVAWHAGGGRITEDSWTTLDDFLYGIGE